MAKDIGQIGSAWVSLETRSNVREGVQKAVREAKQEAGKQKVFTQAESDAYTDALRNRLAAEKDARLLSLYGTADLSKINQMGAARTLPDKRADDAWQNRIRKPHAAGDVMQRLAGLYETDRGRGELAKQLHQEKLAHDAQKRIDFERMRIRAGAFAANIDRASTGLKSFTGALFGSPVGAASVAGLGLVAGGVFKAHRDFDAYRDSAGVASPITAFWKEQNRRDAMAIEGRNVLPSAKIANDLDREMINAQEFWRKQRLAGNKPGIFNITRWQQDWQEVSSDFALGWKTVRNWFAGVKDIPGVEKQNTFGAGGIERLGDWFGGADAVWKQAASMASQTPMNEQAEQTVTLKEIRDLLKTKLPNGEPIHQLSLEELRAKLPADLIRAAEGFGPR